MDCYCCIGVGYDGDNGIRFLCGTTRGKASGGVVSRKAEESKDDVTI